MALYLQPLNEGSLGIEEVNKFIDILVDSEFTFGVLRFRLWYFGSRFKII